MIKSILYILCSMFACYLYADKKNNILFLFADDWGRHASIYAKLDGPGSINDVIQTPNFDALAKKGVLFNNAFVSSPSCTPCRSSILAGQHFWRTTTASFLIGKWDFNLPAYPLILEKAGYKIGFSYKVWKPGSPANAPHGGKRATYQKAGMKFNGFSQNVTKHVAGGDSPLEAKEKLMEEARRNFKQFIADRNPSEPFCYWFGPTNVHRKWTKGSGKALWGMDPDRLKGKMPPFLPDVPLVREDLNDYLGEAQAFDMSLGVIIDELKKMGEYENTFIAISGDHGAPGFPHGKCNLYDFGCRVPLLILGPNVKGGRVVDDFVTLPDLAPTFLEFGNTDIPKSMTGKSLWPVLKSAKEGLVDSKRTEVYIGRERHFPSARKDNLPYPQRAIRNKDYLFIINFEPERMPLGDPLLLGSDKEPDWDALTQSTKVTLRDEDAGPTKAWIVKNRNEPEWRQYYTHAYGKRPRYELYDIRRDPHQMKNLASNPEFANVMESLKTQLMTELERTKDPRVIENGTYFEQMASKKGKKKKTS